MLITLLNTRITLTMTCFKPNTIFFNIIVIIWTMNQWRYFLEKQKSLLHFHISVLSHLGLATYFLLLPISYNFTSNLLHQLPMETPTHKMNQWQFGRKHLKTEPRWKIHHSVHPQSPQRALYQLIEHTGLLLVITENGDPFDYKQWQHFEGLPTSQC